MSAGWIVGVGARGPLGLSAAQVAMCARAKKMEPTETRFVDGRGEPIATCRALAVPDAIHGYDRLLRLASPALCEAWPSDVREALPVLLALPAAGRADDDPRFEEAFLRDLGARSERPIDLGRSRVIRAGSAGFAAAVEAAIAARSAVVVGGVDSHHHPGVLADLDAELRLHAPGIEDGFIPSEGAAFVRLSPERPPRVEGALAITRAATSDEPEVGLARVIRAVREGDPIRWLLSDANGEQDRARELAIATMRALSGDEAQIDEPLRDVGDVGAAAGATLLAMACTWIEVGCARGSDVVIALSSDGEARGAIRVRAAE